MECPHCGLPTYVVAGKYSSEQNSTDVYLEQVVVCTNRKCSMYAGKDLNNPQHIVSTIRHKLT